ncbi:hypothetical protein [Paenibacillus sp. BJ-4]|uniref:hypothetical protein n=1 Tax=Paenibacillus sp. BJ-4 TaxID=2878097 RepID=UPI001CEFF4FC|nr:hypothetical protein [Paenibacillus sp. BJ-4]
MFCNDCQCGFVWQYGFVAPGKRYSSAFEKQALRTATVATVKQSAGRHALPASTPDQAATMVITESERLQEQAWFDATSTASLVLEVDNFAIRKGHTCNTDVHN